MVTLMRLRTTILWLLAAFPGQAGWVTTWSASPSQPYSDPTQLASAHLVFNNQTLREIVHISTGGDTVRVRISNVFGAGTIEVGSAHVALRTTASGIATTSDHTLTFSGRADVTIPPNAILLSDPVAMNVQARADVVISLFFPNSTNAGGIHYLGTATNYIGAGDQTSAATISKATSVSFFAFLQGVDVMVAAPDAATIVTLGDSITDGAHSTSNANHRWPDYLADNLLASGLRNIAVANSGISGNRILHDTLTTTSGVNALARLGRDVLEQPG
jgi:hypothetical protein